MHIRYGEVDDDDDGRSTRTKHGARQLISAVATRWIQAKRTLPRSKDIAINSYQYTRSSDREFRRQGKNISPKQDKNDGMKDKELLAEHTK